MSDIQTTPHEVLASRVWDGTKWHYPNIERLLATIAACKTAAEDAIDNAERAMDQDESWARLHAGLRDVIAAANGRTEQK